MLIRPSVRPALIAIHAAVAEAYSCDPYALREVSNRHRIVEPRHAAMYVQRMATDASLVEIGKYWGGKHHTTVLHAIRSTHKRRGKDAEFDALAAALVERARRSS